MAEFDEIILFQKNEIHVYKGDKPHDANYDEDIIISIGKASNDGRLRPNVLLRPLWNLKDTDEPRAYKEKFSPGDFFQQTFDSNNRPGSGSILQDFLLANGYRYSIKNVYSTLKSEDGFDISDPAIDFWKRRIAKGLAVFDDTLKRYKILFPQV